LSLADERWISTGKAKRRAFDRLKASLRCDRWRKITEQFGVDPDTVQRISRPRPFADGAASVVV
jgi:hypothetical protein